MAQPRRYWNRRMDYHWNRRMDYPLAIMWRSHNTRFAFHHENENGRFTPGDMLVSVIDDRTMERVTYRLNRSRSFPLRELMYTFVEQVGLRMEQLEFRYKGRLITTDATPESLGMRRDCPEENVIAVATVTSVYDRRVEMFTRLNRMAKISIGVGSFQGGAVFSSDLLPRILDFVSLETLVNTSRVCRHWFHVSQRFSVLLQLQDGDSHAWQEQQRYPLLLHDGCRHSFNLALCDAKGMKDWNTSVMRKESTDDQGFGYCKSYGCTVGKTVSMESISRDLDSKWEALDSSKTEFMRQVQNAAATSPPPPEEVTDTADELHQELPPFGEEGDGFIADARNWRYKNCAVELYRRYFSPDMYYIFPLMVNKQAAVGLDFRSTHTSLIFSRPSSLDPRPGRRMRQRTSEAIIRAQRSGFPGLLQDLGDGLPSPVGSVSWRIHDADVVASKGIGDANGRRDVVLHGWTPQIVLEVLFIAVWETDRGAEYGSALVAALQSKAICYAKERGHKSALLYVEIGFEQPKAKNFWGNNGLLPVHRKIKSQSTIENSDRAIELEDWQLGFIDRRCLRFKDTEQYAKIILV